MPGGWVEVKTAAKLNTERLAQFKARHMLMKTTTEDQGQDDREGMNQPFQQSPFQQSPFQQSPFQQSPFQQTGGVSAGLEDDAGDDDDLFAFARTAGTGPCLPRNRWTGTKGRVPQHVKATREQQHAKTKELMEEAALNELEIAADLESLEAEKAKLEVISESSELDRKILMLILNP